MRIATIVLAFQLLHYAAPAQSYHGDIDSIITEGKRLYRLEMSAWMSSAALMRNNKPLLDKAGGYFSYETGNLIQCVFYDTSINPSAIASFLFDTSLKVSSTSPIFTSRPLTEPELRLWRVRRSSLERMGIDTLFTRYDNTSFNLLPVLDETGASVYVRTEPEVNGVVIFGGDYLLRFNEKDSLLFTRTLHHGIIPIEFGKDTDPELIETFHRHPKEAGKFISPTDICTLLLYQRFAKWKQHIVMSRTHVCIWEMDTHELVWYTIEEWNKMNNNKKLVGQGFND